MKMKNKIQLNIQFKDARLGKWESFTSYVPLGLFKKIEEKSDYFSHWARGGFASGGTGDL